MIKITEHIKINPLTIALFVFGIIFKCPTVFYVSYAVMALHETAHLVAAVCVGLKIDCVILQPFGLNLRLKNRIVNTFSDEVILYLSGPLFNAAAALLSLWIYGLCGVEVVREFYAMNIALFAVNMLPAMPLDGGALLKRFLSRRLGYRTANRISGVISAVICATLAALGVYVVTVNRTNFSLILFSLLLMGNIFTQREKYDVDFVSELMFAEKKKKNRVRLIAADTDTDMRDVAARFNRGCYAIVYFIDNDGKIADVKTETEIIEGLTSTYSPQRL